MVSIQLVCFDTKHPTIAPSTAPTTAAPTLAPTEVCTAVEVSVDASGSLAGTIPGVALYNGIYNKQETLINGKDWWTIRMDNKADTSSTVTLYWSDIGARWILEASEISWISTPGIPDYFGGVETTWEQFSLSLIHI